MTKGLYILFHTFTNTHCLPLQHNNGENEWGGGIETRVCVHTWCIFAWLITSEVIMSSVLLLRGHKLLLRNYLQETKSHDIHPITTSGKSGCYDSHYAFLFLQWVITKWKIWSLTWSRWSGTTAPPYVLTNTFPFFVIIRKVFLKNHFIDIASQRIILNEWNILEPSINRKKIFKNK